MDGAVLVDKPSGMTSYDVIRQIKKRFSPGKIGHAGTLDPMARGLLVVLLGKATKLQTLFLDSDKVYAGSIKLGLSSNTDDITGEVIEVDKSFADGSRTISDDELKELERVFTGRQKQVPPAFSAIKVSGVRSYKLARAAVAQNKELHELSPREIEVYSLELKLLAPDSLGYSLHCSKGTYVRSLARDLGERLNTSAVLESICRERSGGFQLPQALSLEKLLELPDLCQSVIPLQGLVSELPRLELSEDDCQQLHQGNQEGLERNRFMLLENPQREFLSDGMKIGAIFDQCGSFHGMAQAQIPPDASLQGSRLSWRVRFLMD